MAKFAAILAFLLASSCFTAWGLGPETDEIKSLPGAPSSLPFKQYSGYAEVNSTNGRNLFYWFVESQSSPSQDPLVLWLNGGPGCSSLGGFMTEHGPFRAKKDNTLYLNDYSWNKVANVLYLESPSGVGFSFSKTESDYRTCGDRRSATDIVAFLVQFLKAYPTLKGRPFYISGESYGGHYVPTTALAIVEHNTLNAGADDINLQGILAGNAWTLPGADNLGIVQTWLGYNLIQAETGADVIKYCNLSHMLPIKEQKLLQANGVRLDPILCQKSLRDVSEQNGNIDPYDIYEALCLETTGMRRSAFLTKLAQSSAPLSAHAGHVLEKMQDVNPCESNYAQAYLNLASVQTAIHARPTKWSECNMQINSDYSRADFLASMLPVHKYLLEHNIRIMIFSGDVDAVVPTHGSRNWIAALEEAGTIHKTKTWAPWTDSTTQVGGYVVRYGPQFTFATVRGAGHMVPATQPLRALDMFSRYLKNSF